MKNIKFLVSGDSLVRRESLTTRLLHSKIADFYRAHLKKFKACRYVALSFLKFVYFNAVQIQNISSKKNKRSQTYRLVDPNFFVSQFGFNSYLLLDSIEIHHELPGTFPYEMVRYFVPLNQTFPKVVVIEIPNANCYSNSNIVTYDSYAIHHSLYRFDSDTTSEELHKIHRIRPESKKLIKNPVSYFDISVESAANFMDACSMNYAHWMTEVLPRILIFCADERFKSVPILVDLNLHKNIVSSLSSVIDSGREIYFVDANIRLNIKKLLFVDAVGYVPFGRRGGFDGPHSDGIFYPEALMYARDTCFEISGRSVAEVNSKKIFLRRGLRGRSLINAEEIEFFFQSRGYDLVDTNSLSFIDQVKLFQDATHVVSATGSALANCLFCKEGVSVLVLMGKHDDMIYGYWRNMLGPLGLSVNYVLGDIVDLKSTGIHGNFRVNLDDLEEVFAGNSKW